MHLVEDIDVVQEILLNVDFLQVEEVSRKLLYHGQIIELPVEEGNDVRVPRMLPHEVLDNLSVYSSLATVSLLVVARSVLLGFLVIVERASRGV